MHVKVIKVKYIKSYLLEITFETGEKEIVDLSGYAKRGGVFRNFSNIDYFKRVSIDKDWGVLCWPGDVDIAPETLYRLATGKESDELTGSLSNTRFS
jgi:hypothetical protein